ncbi:MAG: S8 family serine peptidase [Leptolyngbyaceae cyanobacterium]
MDLRSRSLLPPKIFAEAVVRSHSGESLLRSSRLITSENVALFHATPNLLGIAAERLRAADFEVLDIGSSSINIAAAPEVYARALGANLEVIERPVTKDLGRREIADFINSADPAPLGEIDISQTPWNDILDGVAISEPAYFLQRAQLSATPPQTNTRYLNVPDELAIELGATEAHAQGITGKGVKVVIVDSGCFTEHPFFKQNNYDIDVVLGPGSVNPKADVSGHGTGVVANLLAIAPDADLTVLKADIALRNKSRNVNSVAAFRAAVALKPDIISCSWGSDLRNPYELSSFHKVMAAAIADAVRQGIAVFFAAGNGQWGFPSQHPDVIAVGGVFKHLEGSLKGRVEASNYASSFISAIYPGRRVPDVCGLVGRLPNAAYILLPVSPGSSIDQVYAAVDDETTATDGWAAFSGTSSAAPQLAGACALLEQFVPGLGPLKTKQILQETALDILEGSSNPASGSRQARAGPDLATGYGLAVAYKAIQAAKKQKESQRNRSSKFDQPLESAVLSSTQDSHQTLADFCKFNYQEINTMSTLDDYTLRKIRQKIDEIQIDLNSCLKERHADLANENIELVIHEGNFIERLPESEATSYLLETLRSVLNSKDNESKINPALIEKRHVFAAESLLKKGKCISLAKDVLVAAMKLKGKHYRYIVAIDGRTFEILPEYFSKLILSSSENFTLIINTEAKATVKGINLEGEVETITSQIKNKVLTIDIVDRDRISELAAEAIGEIHKVSSLGPFGLLGDKVCDDEVWLEVSNGWVKQSDPEPRTVYSAPPC